MTSTARLEFARVGELTHLVRGQFTWPFFISRQQRSRESPRASVVTLQSASGTLNAGDSTEATIVAGAYAHAWVRPQGGPSVHRSDSGASAMERTEIRAAEGAVVDHVAEPRVLFPDSRYEQSIGVDVCADASVLLADGIVVLQGDSGRSFSSYSSDLRISRDGVLLVDETNATGPWSSAPGRVREFRAIGQVVVVAAPDRLLLSIPPEWNDTNCSLASMALPNSAGTVIRIAAVDGYHLRRCTEQVVRRVRPAIAEQSPAQTAR